VHPLYSFLASTHVLFGISMFILIFATYCSPGMNSCKITEDETTKALHALYVVPAPENSIKDGGHDATAGIVAAIAPTFKGNIQYISISGKVKGSHGGANVGNAFDLADMSKPSKEPHVPSSSKTDGVDCSPTQGKTEDSRIIR